MLTLGALAFLALAAAVPVWVVARAVREFHLSRRGASAQGEVVAVTTGDGSDWAIVVFRDWRDRAHQFRSDVPYAPGALRIGAPIAVCYDPRDPRRARERGRPLARAVHGASWLFAASISGIVGAKLLPL